MRKIVYEKVSYTAKNGSGPHEAYIDVDSGRGTEKHSDEPVWLVWSGYEHRWMER